jgi:sugar lactone lactonase YvrE
MKRHTIHVVFVSAMLICLDAAQVVAQETQKTSMIARLNGKTVPYSRSANYADGAIQGAVQDENGDPVMGIEVSAGDYNSLIKCDNAKHFALTDSNGHYTLNVPQGKYLVFVNSHQRAEGYLPEAYPGVRSWAKINSAASISVDARQAVAGIDFNLLFGYRLTGRLVDRAGRPVTGAAWDLEDPVQQIEYTCALGGRSSYGDGTFEFNIPAGLYDLSFNVSGNKTVFKGKIIRADTSLGDVIFEEADTPFAVFNPQAVMPGYSIETVVESAANCPSDVAVTSDGNIYLAAVRSRKIFRVSQKGGLSTLAREMVYSLQAGSDDNLYGYFHPAFPKGEILKITTGGGVSDVGTVDQTSCESTLGVSPNLELVIGYNPCSGTGMGASTLFHMTMKGDVETMFTGLGYINGLDFDASGHLYMTSGNKLYQVYSPSGKQPAYLKPTIITNLPGSASHHGLAVSKDGTKYISTCSWDKSTNLSDHIYKVDSNNNVSLMATLPAGCLEGLALDPNGDLIGTMRCTGALYRIHPEDGHLDTLLQGNGMATPDVMAFGPDGELFVNNSESAIIVKIKDGRGQFFTQVNSFTPPYASLAFLPSGDFYYSEAAPGLKPYLTRISPSGDTTHVTGKLDFPSGLAFSSSGQLFVVESMAGEISKVTSDGKDSTFASGFVRPQALAADSQGNLYVGHYSGTCSSDPAVVTTSDLISKVNDTGAPTQILAHDLNMIAVSPADELFISGSVGYNHYGVLRVNSDKSLTPIAIGFLSPVGLAFDVAGDLYVSDDQGNSIVRITGFSHGHVEGTVTSSESGAPIKEGVVSLKTGYPLIKGVNVKVDAVRGSFSIQAEARRYTLTASAKGYHSKTLEVTVLPETTKKVNLSLQPSWKKF